MNAGQRAMEQLIVALPEGATSAIDPPLDEEKGVWHLDVTIDGQLEVVSWRADMGYGLYDMPEPTYGQNPNVVVRDPKEAVARMLEIMDKARSAPAPGA